MSMSDMAILRQLSSRDYNVGRYAVSKMASTYIRFGFHLGSVAPLRRGTVPTKREALQIRVPRCASESLAANCLVPTAGNKHVPVG
jgi:hypothetical protein